MPRAVIAGVPHHVTQRGLDRRDVFFEPADYETYLAQVHAHAARFGADLLGYCLMTNHVHWIALPHAPDSLARAFGEAHGRYASYANARLGRSGHFWQNRFFSCPLDRDYLWTALRYVERNPVRARMVLAAPQYEWSSAAAHCGLRLAPSWLAVLPEGGVASQQWAAWLDSDTVEDAEVRVRANTYTGRPAGSPEFVEWAELQIGRRLAPQSGGRPRKERPDAAQARLFA